MYPSGTDALSDAMAADLEACGFRADSDADVMTKKRGKMLMNLGNATAAVSGSSTDAGTRTLPLAPLGSSDGINVWSVKKTGLTSSAVASVQVGR